MPVKRQIGGDADAAYYIVNNVDNGIGYSLENIEDNLGDLASGKATGSDAEGNSNGGGPPGGGASSGGPPPPPPGKRQLNKIGDGTEQLGDDTGVEAVTQPVGEALNEIDGIGTNDQANIGEQIGDIEDPGLPEIANSLTNLDPSGKDVPALGKGA